MDSRSSFRPIVGCAGAGPAQDDDADAAVPYELQMLYVLAQAHGTGLGLRLLDAAIGGKPALLWVLEDNPRAQAFYRKHGSLRTDAARH